MEVRGFEPLAPTLRTQRPHPSDRAICTLTWGFLLNTSHRFAWFRSVSRAERAQSVCVPCGRYPEYRAVPFSTDVDISVRSRVRRSLRGARNMGLADFDGVTAHGDEAMSTTPWNPAFVTSVTSHSSGSSGSRS